jgi:hypothetical protein
MPMAARKRATGFRHQRTGTGWPRLYGVMLAGLVPIAACGQTVAEPAPPNGIRRAEKRERLGVVDG